MKRFYATALTLLSLGCATDSREADPSSPGFNYIAVHWQAPEGEAEVVWHRFLRTGDSVAVEPEALLTTRHFEEARTTYDRDARHHSVDLVMTDEGRERIRRLSAGNDGRHLAVLLDDDVVALGYVSGPIDSEALNLPPMQDEREAESFAHRINGALTSR